MYIFDNIDETQHKRSEKKTHNSHLFLNSHHPKISWRKKKEKKEKNENENENINIILNRGSNSVTNRHE
jgi:hypothetical protein